MKVYFENWSNLDDVVADFFDCRYDRGDLEEKRKNVEGIEVLFAYYGYENYEGDAFVVFRKDGKLYEVNGGHCSCYGLEGLWEPEETSKQALLHVREKGYKFEDWPEDAQAALDAIIETL